MEKKHVKQKENRESVEKDYHQNRNKEYSKQEGTYHDDEKKYFKQEVRTKENSKQDRGNLKKKPVYLKTLSKQEGGRSTPFQKIEKK